MIEIYSARNCSRCCIIEGEVHNKGLEYKIYDIDKLSEECYEDIMRCAREVGQLSLPILIKDGKVVEVGSL